MRPKPVVTALLFRGRRGLHWRVCGPAAVAVGRLALGGRLDLRRLAGGWPTQARLWFEWGSFEIVNVRPSQQGCVKSRLN